MNTQGIVFGVVLAYYTKSAAKFGKPMLKWRNVIYNTRFHWLSGALRQTRIAYAGFLSDSRHSQMDTSNLVRSHSN